MNRAFGSGLYFGIMPVVKNLLIINTLLFLLKQAMPEGQLDGMLGLHAVQSPNFKAWQLLTHMFMHADVRHIFGNMLGLFLFGNSLEHVWGSKRFLFFYLFAGFGAAALQLGVGAWELHQQLLIAGSYGITLDDLRAIAGHELDMTSVQEGWRALLQHSSANTEASMEMAAESAGRVLGMLRGHMIGASGAVFGVMAGFGMMFANEVIMAPGIYIPMKAKYAVLLYAVVEVYLGIRPMSGDSVAHYAHIGGMLFGFLLIKYWRRTTIL